MANKNKAKKEPKKAKKGGFVPNFAPKGAPMPKKC